ncbi:MAG TPA: TatD family hydrolase [Acidimicrobiia bacterium]|jgi:TatD DNase family protein
MAHDDSSDPVPVPTGLGTGWVDTHCHLSADADEADRQLERARAAGVAWLVCVGTDLASSRVAVELARRHDDVRATVGLHPHEASALVEQWPELQVLATQPGVAAIGECGFDLHYTHSPFEEQEAAFRAQVELAHSLDRPLVIHTREAWDHTFRVLGDVGVPRRTVFHCFTGGEPEAARVLEAGGHISFSGIVTFKKAGDVRAAAAMTPHDSVLVETDAPFLAPVPHRGRANEPMLVGIVGAAVAAASGRELGEVRDDTRANAERVFA